MQWHYHSLNESPSRKHYGKALTQDCRIRTNPPQSKKLSSAIEELSSGKVTGRTYEEVMKADRCALQDSRVNAACPAGFLDQPLYGWVSREMRMIQPVSTGFTWKHFPIPEPSIRSTLKRAVIIMT